MAHYRLHCTQGSGNSYKIALYLNCADLDWEPVGVKLADGQTRDANWRAAMNTMGEVPVLETAGKRLTQSGAILLWLAETHCQFAFHPDRTFRGDALAVLRYHKFTNDYAVHRRQHCFTPAPAHESVMAFLRRRVRASFAIAEKHLSTHRFVLGGDKPNDRRLLHGGLRLLSAGRDRLRYRGGLSGDRRLAKAHRRPAGLEAGVRDDAGRRVSPPMRPV